MHVFQCVSVYFSVRVCVSVCVGLTEVDAVLGPAPPFRDPALASKVLIGCE